MIVDVHTHVWDYDRHFSPELREQMRTLGRVDRELDLTVEYEQYRAGAAGCDRTVVFGGKARLSGLWVDDAFVAQYARLHQVLPTGGHRDHICARCCCPTDDLANGITDRYRHRRPNARDFEELRATTEVPAGLLDGPVHHLGTESRWRLSPVPAAKKLGPGVLPCLRGAWG